MQRPWRKRGRTVLRHSHTLLIQLSFHFTIIGDTPQRQRCQPAILFLLLKLKENWFRVGSCPKYPRRKFIVTLALDRVFGAKAVEKAFQKRFTRIAHSTALQLQVLGYPKQA